MANTSTAPEKSKTVVEIERLGFSYTEVAQFDLTRLSTSRRVQVRDASHYAPKESVERYAVQMAHSEFPPIVVTSDDWIVDGNTRTGAALLRGVKFFPALVLNVAFQGASTKQENELHALAATLNALNGMPLTAKETRDVVDRFVRLGWKAEQIGRAIGVKATAVAAAKREIDAVAKLRRVGLDPDSSVRAASLRALGAKDTLALNDVPFKELAKLASDAGLNAGEITSIAREVKEVGSDTGQVARVDELRVELGDRIRERALTGVGTPSLSRQLRQHLGFVAKYEGCEPELIETDPNVAGRHLDALEKAIKILTALAEIQRPK